MARKRDYPQLEYVYYNVRRKRCDEGHEGRIGRFTKFCAGCVQEHLERGGYKWR